MRTVSSRGQTQVWLDSTTQQKILGNRSILISACSCCCQRIQKYLQPYYQTTERHFFLRLWESSLNPPHSTNSYVLSCFFFCFKYTWDKQKTEFTSSCLGGTTVAAVSMKGLAEETVFGFSLPIGETWQWNMTLWTHTLLLSWSKTKYWKTSLWDFCQWIPINPTCKQTRSGNMDTHTGEGSILLTRTHIYDIY